MKSRPLPVASIRLRPAVLDLLRSAQAMANAVARVTGCPPMRQSDLMHQAIRLIMRRLKRHCALNGINPDTLPVSERATGKGTAEIDAAVRAPGRGFVVPSHTV